VCTLTIIAAGRSGECRLAFNRDEQRTRGRARPPSIWRLEGNAVMMLAPTDADAEGTWIGVSDHGLIAAVLNVNPPGPPPGGTISRGLIVPAVLSRGSLADALDRLATLPTGAMKPFRLVLTDGRELAEVVGGERAQNTIARSPVPGAWMRCSSGLGDGVVEPARRALFESMVHSCGRFGASEQDAFHAHRWEGRGHLSVLMSRADARTVSRTVITLGAGLATVSYADIDDDGPRRAIASSVALVHREGARS
jgi:hypothetical protein